MNKDFFIKNWFFGVSYEKLFEESKLGFEVENNELWSCLISKESKEVLARRKVKKHE